jgi:hypothetical protein
MRPKLISAATLTCLATATFFLACGSPSALAADMKFEAMLLWGTNDSTPLAGKDYKPVPPDVLKKLHELPLKWTNWFVVRSNIFSLVRGETKEVTMSDKCQLKLKVIGGNETEVSLIGKGKEVMKRKQALPKTEMLFLGGNAPGSTAWLVALKRLE